MNKTQNKSKKINVNSTPAPGTIFRSKIFVVENGQRYSKSAVAVRAVKKLSKLEKKWVKKLRVKSLKEKQNAIN